MSLLTFKKDFEGILNVDQEYYSPQEIALYVGRNCNLEDIGLWIATVSTIL